MAFSHGRVSGVIRSSPHFGEYVALELSGVNQRQLWSPNVAKPVSERISATALGEYHPFLYQKFTLNEVLTSADVHFTSQHEECTGLGVRSKTSAALTASRPIINEGNKEGEAHRTVSESGVGAAGKSGDVERPLSTTRRRVSDLQERRELCEKSRGLLGAKYAAAHVVRSYLEMLAPWL